MPNTGLALVFGLSLVGVCGGPAWPQAAQQPFEPFAPATTVCSPQDLQAGWPPAGSAPTDVIATLGGQEITRGDLLVEMGQATFADPQARKAAEIRALSEFIKRRILANAARRQGLDKTPQVATGKSRPPDSVLVQALSEKILAGVPPPTQAEIETFIAANPYLFSEHKIFYVDQIHISQHVPLSLLKELEPTKTMHDFEDILKIHNISYKRLEATLDTDNMDQRLVKFIMTLPPRELFVMPDKEGDGLLANVIHKTETVPLAKPAALDLARNLVAQRHVEAVAVRAREDIFAKALAEFTIRKDYDCAWSNVFPPATQETAPASPAGY